MSDIFEGTGVKRYALRYRANAYSVWEYPRELEYDTLAEARAALDAMEVSGGYQIVEKYPCILWKPAGAEETARSKLLDNSLEECGAKPYRLQWSNGSGSGWWDCPELQFDTLAEAQGAAYSGKEGSHRIMTAVLYIRYEPAEVTADG